MQSAVVIALIKAIIKKSIYVFNYVKKVVVFCLVIEF